MMTLLGQYMTSVFFWLVKFDLWAGWFVVSCVSDGPLRVSVWFACMISLDYEWSDPLVGVVKLEVVVVLV